MNMLLEGADLQELLAKAARTGGPGTRIVRAEKIRTGGLYGFFAREAYRVTIEVPASPQSESPVSESPVSAPPVSAPRVPQRPSTSLLELAERASTREHEAALSVARQTRYRELEPAIAPAPLQSSWPVSAELPAADAVIRLND
jgi:hypothetical protein